MYAVLSPAKALRTPERHPALTTSPLAGDTRELMATCSRWSAADIQDLMGLSDKLSELNFERFQAFGEGAPTAAALTFNGDTYRGLDATTLSDADLLWAQDHVGILSGLYGILRPLDGMWPYRLEMKTKVKTSRGKDLYAFWGNEIAEVVKERLGESKTLIALASKEYFKAIPAKQTGATVITPVFKEQWDGKERMVSFMAKAARGMMARHIIENQLTDPQDLKSFNAGGYRFDAARSTDTEWLFTRPKPAPKGR